MLPIFKRRPNSDLFRAKKHLCFSFVLLLPMSQVSIAGAVNACSALEGIHAVSILYPWASPQQWPTWESRPGGGINQLPPSLGGLLPAHHAAAPGRALLGSIPMRACWNSQR